jgi:hypothetical protein
MNKGKRKLSTTLPGVVAKALVGAGEYAMMPKIGWNSIFISSVKYAHRGVSSAA